MRKVRLDIRFDSDVNAWYFDNLRENSIYHQLYFHVKMKMYDTFAFATVNSIDTSVNTSVASRDLHIKRLYVINS